MLFSDWIWPKHRNTWIWLWQSECMPPQPFNFYCVSNDAAGQAISRILQQDVFLVFSKKTRSNWTPNDSFGFCSSRGFQNTPYMLNLIKFWLRYLRLKTVDIFKKLYSSSSFSLSIILVNSSANSKICSSWGFQNCHWLLKLMKNWLRYSRLKERLNFQKVNESMNLTSSVAK